MPVGRTSAENNRNYGTEIYTDACQNEYGAVLLQKSPTDDKLHLVLYEQKNDWSWEKVLELRTWGLGSSRSSQEIPNLFVGQNFQDSHKLLCASADYAQTRLNATYSKMNTISSRFRLCDGTPSSNLEHVDALIRHSVMTVINHDITPKESPRLWRYSAHQATAEKE